MAAASVVSRSQTLTRKSSYARLLPQRSFFERLLLSDQEFIPLVRRSQTQRALSKHRLVELVSVSASSKETPPLELKLQRWRWLPSRYLKPKLTSGKAELMIVIVFRAILMKVQEALQLVQLHNLRKHVSEEVRPEGKSIWLVYVQWILLVTLPYLPQKRGKGSGNNSSPLRYCYVLPKLCNNFVSCGTGEGMNVSSSPHPLPTSQ